MNGQMTDTIKACIPSDKRAMSDRSESEVYAAIVEAGKKAWVRTKSETARSSVQVHERPRCVCFTSKWKWEEPVLFCAVMDLRQAEKTSETKFTGESACRPNKGPGC